MKGEMCTGLFMNLSNPLKMRIILSLYKKEKSVGELMDDLKEEQSKLSHALASLRECNIVKIKRSGKKRIYSLNKRTITPFFYSP